MRSLVLLSLLSHLTVIYSVTLLNQLECSINTARLSNIITDIESKGYTVQKQHPAILSSAGSSNDLAPNKGGAYANIVRRNATPYDIKRNFIGQTFDYKMGAKTAVLYHGCTPPIVKYFGYKTYIWKNDKNIWIWGALGDVINNNVIKTYNSFTSYAPPPFDDMTTIITTADNDTYHDIVDSYKTFGINQSMINLDAIPADIIKMGTAANTSLHTFFRVSLPTDYEKYISYFKYINDDNFISVYFITQGNETNQTLSIKQIAKDPVRNRTCDNPLYPGNGDESYLQVKYDSLRDILIDTMKDKFDYKNIKFRVISGNEYVGSECIKNKLLCGGNSPDALYYEDYNNQTFLIKYGKQNILNMNIDGYKLNDNNLYVIMGVNHYNLGLSTFNQESLYIQNFSAIVSDGATMDNFEYNMSANYFNDNDDDYSEFYMIMYVRPGKCVQELVDNGVKCVEIGYDELGRNKGFIVFSRVYMNPCTNTGPSKDQFLSEYLLEFQVVQESEDNVMKYEVNKMVTVCLLLLFFICY